MVVGGEEENVRESPLTPHLPRRNLRDGKWQHISGLPVLVCVSGLCTTPISSQLAKSRFECTRESNGCTSLRYIQSATEAVPPACSVGPVQRCHFPHPLQTHT